ncbi:MAG: dTDP-glucose 4,6-dehydratase [Desulfonauticus sp.]|nr:dTDP-glucose 4,6-dehydratase [Desulfonauticus sp.]
MRILVTGGAGFIGSNFIHYLFKHYSDLVVVNLDKLTYAGNLANLLDIEKKYKNSKYFFIHGDIANRELVAAILEQYQLEVIVNFAAESHVDRSIFNAYPFVQTNVVGTQNLLECAKKAKIQKFIHISTDEVYGSLGKEGKFSESTPLAPNSPYSASKAGADFLCRSYFKTYGFPVIITRCSNNYGPFQFPEKLIPLTFLRAMKDEPIPVYGQGENVRDWIFVEDHCYGIDLAMQRGKPGAIYNFGGNAEKKNIEVVKAILDFLGKPHSLITFVKDRPGHDFRYAMDFSYAQKELGFSPRISFEKGLEITLKWYQNNLDWISQIQSGEYLTFMETWYGK